MPSKDVEPAPQPALSAFRLRGGVEESAGRSAGASADSETASAGYFFWT